MYDLCLMEDLKEFKRGAKNIYELQCSYETIYKIIKNRTSEKIKILKFLLSSNVINQDFYNELLRRTKSDYRTSHLYLLGLTSLE